MSRLALYRRLVLLSCLLSTFVNGGLFYTFGIFFKPLAAEFAWSRGQLSLVNTVFLLSYAPGAVILGRLADRYQPRGVMGLAALFIGLGLLLCGRSSAWEAFVFNYALIGFGTGATLGIPTATVQRWFVRSRGLMVGMVAAGGGLGSLAFSLLAAHIVGALGWRQGFIYLSALMGPLLLVSAALMFHSPEKSGLAAYEEGGVSAPTGPGMTTGRALRTGNFRSLTSLYVLSFIPSFFLMVHLVPYATDRGVPALAAAGALGMMGAFSAPGRLIMGHIADRIGWLPGLALTSFLCAFTLLWLPFVTDAWALYLFVLAYGFGYGGLLPQLMGAMTYFFGTPSLSELLGYALGISVIAGAFSPSLAGFIFDRTGNYLSIIALSMMCHTAAGIWALRLR